MLRRDTNNRILDTLDLVVHSMGYAYSLGMIDELRGKIPLGRFYIIAPENAGSGSINLSDFEEVWQYGSDLNRGDGKQSDPLDKQDGVAPQTTVGGLYEEQRIYIPDGQPKGFIQSHAIGNYRWIFTLPKSRKGYVKPRE